MTIRTDADIQRLREERALTTAEDTLIETCRAGEPTMLGEDVPDGPSDTRTVRADLLRYLITGGCAKCPTQDAGVFLLGAYVTGTLDLDFSKAKGATELLACRFEKQIEALQARFEFLNLNRSHLRGLSAQVAQVTGNVFLREITTQGEVSLSGSRIGGQLDCQGARLINAEGKSLNAQDARVAGGVFLNRVKSEGQVHLLSATTTGQLNFKGAHLLNSGGAALNAQKMDVVDFVWRKVADIQGTVVLDGARATDLVDDADSWDLADGLFLNGFSYEIIHGPVSAEMRRDWLRRGSFYDNEFWPQPYEQLARVLRSMGHEAGRRAVLIEKQHLQRADERKRLRGIRGFALWPFKWLLDFMSWLVIGYGYRPFRVVWALTLLLGIGWGIAYQAWHAGDFAPNSDVILSTPAWQALAEGDVANPAAEWSAKYGAGRDWETFNSAAYAFDVVVPIVTIGQTEAWAPSTTRGDWGWHLWWARWVLTILGWIVTAVGAAAITGIIRRE